MKTKSFVVVAWAIPAAVLILTGKAPADDAPATRPAAPTTRPAEVGGRRLQPGAFLNRLHELVNGLNLTADQKPKVEAMFAKASDDMKTTLASAREQGTDRREVGQKIRSIMNDLRDGLKTILTEDQVQALQQQLPGQSQANGGGPGQLLQRITSAFDKLNLSDDQKKQVEDVLKATRDQIEKIRGQATSGTDDTRGKFRAAIEEARQKLENILTPDQKEKFGKIQEEREQQRGQGNSPATAPQ